MTTGIENVSNEVIVFIDADLSNLQEDHFAQLTTPVLNSETDMVLGQTTETLINYSINPFKSFTGERTVLKKVTTQLCIIILYLLSCNNFLDASLFTEISLFLFQGKMLMFD